GWSTEILPLIEDNRELAAVVPKSGTILTADLWVRPAQAPDSQADNAAEPSAAESSKRTQLIQDWLAFCWQDQIATQLSLLSSVASPIFWERPTAQLPQSLQQKPLVVPPPEVMQKSEFLLPLSEQAMAQYRQLWTTVRQG
ncbi:MAG TPA: polyamine ABC transporter substrate-binding protein, partial [Allocoleopsis sp.]